MVTDVAKSSTPAPGYTGAYAFAYVIFALAGHALVMLVWHDSLAVSCTRSGSSRDQRLAEQRRPGTWCSDHYRRCLGIQRWQHDHHQVATGQCRCECKINEGIALGCVSKWLGHHQRNLGFCIGDQRSNVLVNQRFCHCLADIPVSRLKLRLNTETSA